MLKFICLGSGSSGNSYFLFSENYGLLIDAGIGIRTLKKHFHTYGLSLKQIKAVLITHDHADHIKAVGSLANEYGLPVYATELVHDGIKRNYCANPVSMPSRFAMITGRFAGEIGYTNNSTKPDTLRVLPVARESSVGNLFRNAGYETI